MTASLILSRPQIARKVWSFCLTRYLARKKPGYAGFAVQSDQTALTKYRYLKLRTLLAKKWLYERK